MYLPGILTVFAWILVVASAAAVLAALFLASSFFQAMQDAAVPAGVLLALAGHLFTQAKTRFDIEERRSQFNLDGVRLALSHAKTLLDDGNNRRATWIGAARSIAHGLELAKRVTIEGHQRVLEVERLKYRGSFHQVLASKPAAFFYGVPLIEAGLDEAAKASTAMRVVDDRPLWPNDELDEASIRMVWAAAQWPKDYEDPKGPRFEKGEEDQLLMLYPRLHAFLQHKRQWRSAAGKLNQVESDTH